MASCFAYATSRTYRNPTVYFGQDLFGNITCLAAFSYNVVYANIIWKSSNNITLFFNISPADVVRSAVFDQTLILFSIKTQALPFFYIISMLVCIIFFLHNVLRRLGLTRAIVFSADYTCRYLSTVLAFMDASPLLTLQRLTALHNSGKRFTFRNTITILSA